MPTIKPIIVGGKINKEGNKRINAGLISSEKSEGSGINGIIIAAEKIKTERNPEKACKYVNPK